MSDIKRIKCHQTGEVFDNILKTAEAFSCSETTISYVIKGKQSNYKGLTFEIVSEIRSPELVNDWVLRDKTHELYGYYPEYLSKNSRQKIVVKCPYCKKEYSRVRQKYKPNSYCTSCTYGDFLRQAAFRKRKPKKAKIKQEKQDPHIRRFSDRIRASMGRICRKKTSWRKRGNMTHVDYTSTDLYNHINNELKGGCCICGKEIEKDNFHIAHIIPASFARTKEDVLLVYSLINLSVAHAKCNISLGDRIVIPKLLPAC